MSGHSTSLPAVLAFLGLVISGCGGTRSDAPTTFTVTGTVKIDGSPLPNGTISFESPEDVKSGFGAATAEITDGDFETQARAGKKTVRISHMEEFGEADVTGVKPTRETIAAEFNENSTIEAEVTEDGENTFDFDVKPR